MKRRLLYALLALLMVSGCAALATRSHGHPSAAEQMELAQGLAGFLTENGLI